MNKYVLTIDIDKPYKVIKRLFDKWLEVMNDIASMIAWYDIRPSPSGNTHIIVALREELTCEDRLRVARLLGDDALRSWLNYIRCVNGERREILFNAKRRIIVMPEIPKWLFQ